MHMGKEILTIISKTNTTSTSYVVRALMRYGYIKRVSQAMPMRLGRYHMLTINPNSDSDVKHGITAHLLIHCSVQFTTNDIYYRY